MTILVEEKYKTTLVIGLLQRPVKGINEKKNQLCSVPLCFLRPVINFGIFTPFLHRKVALHFNEVNDEILAYNGTEFNIRF